MEEACRQLRQEVPAPFLRDWAEHAVRSRHELEPEELGCGACGDTLVAMLGVTDLIDVPYGPESNIVEAA